MTEAGELRFGFAGAGYAAHLRARAMRGLGKGRIRAAAVWSRNPERARLFAGELGVPLTGSLEELCSTDAVNAVLVALPNRMHYEVIRRALELGKHVLAEYPLVLTGYRQAEELCRLASRRGLLLHVGQTMNWDADHAFIRAHSGELGRLYLGYKYLSFGATGSWYQADGFPGDSRGLGDWYVSDTTRGGWIVSSHYHGIQIFRRLFGEVAAVAAFDSTTGGVSAASVLMRHESGASTSVQWAMPIGGKAFSKTIVTGPAGSIEIDGGRFLLEAGGRRTEGALPAVDTFAEDLSAMLEELDGKRDARAELADSMRNLAVTMAAEKSAATGREVAVPRGRLAG
jgi:predicted dehydrogenase